MLKHLNFPTRKSLSYLNHLRLLGYTESFYSEFLRTKAPDAQGALPRPSRGAARGVSTEQYAHLTTGHP